VYRRLEKLAVYTSDPETREKLRQWEWVQSFFAQFRGEDGSLHGGYNPYKIPDEFRRQFEGHLRSLIYDFANSREFVPADSLARRPQVPMWPGSPFPGLRSFTPADEPIFFGRGAEIDGIVRRFDENSRFLGVIGSSGSGKSSLVAAGLIPSLQRNALEGSHRWEYVRFTPGGADGDPFKALAASLSQKLVSESSDVDEWAVDILTAKLAGGRSTAAETLERVVEQMQATELLVFIDQFEELFTVATASSPGYFVQLLTAAVRSSRPMGVAVGS
jgi:hypothetical protein